MCIRDRLDTIRRPGEASVIPGVYFGDMTCGMWAAIGVLAAIYHREHTGLGQYVDTSIYEGLIPMMNMYAGRYFAAGHNVERAPQALSLIHISPSSPVPQPVSTMTSARARQLSLSPFLLIFVLPPDLIWCLFCVILPTKDISLMYYVFCQTYVSTPEKYTSTLENQFSLSANSFI